MFSRNRSVRSWLQHLLASVVALFIIPILEVSSTEAQTWQTLAPLPQLINSSFFFDTINGFACSGATIGAPNTRPEAINIYRTTNGGLSWTAMQVPQNL